MTTTMTDTEIGMVAMLICHEAEEMMCGNYPFSDERKEYPFVFLFNFGMYEISGDGRVTGYFEQEKGDYLTPDDVRLDGYSIDLDSLYILTDDQDEVDEDIEKAVCARLCQDYFNKRLIA